MKKSLKAALLSSLAVFSVIVMTMPGIAEANFHDDYKKTFQHRVTVSTEQDEAGRIVTTERYRLFSQNGVELIYTRSNGYQTTHMTYTYRGKQIKLYDGMTWGDGSTVYNLPLYFNPIRDVHYGTVTEIIAAKIDPTVFKKALIVSAHSHQYGRETILSSTAHYWPAWKEALEDAEKLMQEK